METNRAFAPYPVFLLQDRIGADNYTVHKEFPQEAVRNKDFPQDAARNVDSVNGFWATLISEFSGGGQIGKVTRIALLKKEEGQFYVMYEGASRRAYIYKLENVLVAEQLYEKLCHDLSVENTQKVLRDAGQSGREKALRILRDRLNKLDCLGNEEILAEIAHALNVRLSPHQLIEQ